MCCGGMLHAIWLSRQGSLVWITPEMHVLRKMHIVFLDRIQHRLQWASIDETVGMARFLSPAGDMACASMHMILRR